MNRIEKLSHLEDILRDVAAKGLPFDLENWAKETDCGYVGCAVGWAMVDPKFIELGFHSKTDIHVDRFGLEERITYPCYVGKYGELHSFSAVNNFFDITLSLAQRFFLDTAYEQEDRHNPLAVANRIRDYLIKECENECCKALS